VKNKVKIGFIGTGDMAATHVSDLMQFAEECEITALADISNERMDLFNSKFRLSAKKYIDYKELLSDRNVDAVIICSPNFIHAEHACAAFYAGKHVLLQKPMALTLPECDKIIEASEKAGKVLQVGLVYRYSALFRTMSEIIKSGRIGEPLMAWCHEFRVPFPIGREREWRYNQELSGGSLVEKDCHHFDLFQWMLGALPVSVHAFGGQIIVNENGAIKPGVPGEQYEFAKGNTNNIIDHAWVNIEFERNKTANLGLCLFTANRELPLGVIGEKGWIEANVHQNKLRIFDGKMGHVEEIQPKKLSHELAGGIRDFGHSGGALEVFEFISCVRENRKAFCDGKIGKESLYAALAAELSIKEKRIVQIKELK
jgi:predicted dehydrogenase